MKKQKEIHNILVINVNWVGDVIFSSPVFKALKAAYPQAKISCLAPVRVAGVLEHIPFLDEVIVLEDGLKWRTPLGKWRLIRLLRRKKFDLAFLLHRSLSRSLLVFLAGIPERIGYDTKGRGIFLTHKTLKIDEKQTHRSDYYLNVAESYGVPVKDRITTLKSAQEADLQMEKFLIKKGINPADFLIVLNPGGNWNLKRWPAEKWSLLIRKIKEKFDAKLVISGALKDVDLGQTIVERNIDGVLVLAGKTDFDQLFSLMKRADLVISGDSGPLHIANSLGTDVIAIFGPTSEKITGPRGSGRKIILRRDIGCNRFACYHLACPDNICMKAVTVGDILEAIGQVKTVG